MKEFSTNFQSIKYYIQNLDSISSKCSNGESIVENKLCDKIFLECFALVLLCHKIEAAKIVSLHYSCCCWLLNICVKIVTQLLDMFIFFKDKVFKLRMSSTTLTLKRKLDYTSSVSGFIC